MNESLILVADDSQEICRFIEENVLVPAGYEVRSVGDGMSALTLAREIKPDLLITDQQMPNLTGIELIQRLRRDLPHLPVILITSEGSEWLVVEAMRAGAVDYLTKPFEAEHLLAAVGKALAERNRWQSLVEAQSEAQTSAESLARRLHEHRNFLGKPRSNTICPIGNNNRLSSPSAKRFGCNRASLTSANNQG